jgi:hypothetical protein
MRTDPAIPDTASVSQPAITDCARRRS